MACCLYVPGISQPLLDNYRTLASPLDNLITKFFVLMPLCAQGQYKVNYLKRMCMCLFFKTKTFVNTKMIFIKMIEVCLYFFQNTPAPAGLQPYTQDALFTHSQFIIDQISSYDSAGDEDERLLLTTPCIRSLIRLVGVTLTR